MNKIILENNNKQAFAILEQDDLFKELWKVIQVITPPDNGKIPTPFVFGFNEIKLTGNEVLVTRYRVKNEKVIFVDVDHFEHIKENIYRETYSGGYSLNSVNIDTAREGT